MVQRLGFRALGAVSDASSTGSSTDSSTGSSAVVQQRSSNSIAR